MLKYLSAVSKKEKEHRGHRKKWQCQKENNICKGTEGHEVKHVENHMQINLMTY